MNPMEPEVSAALGAVVSHPQFKFITHYYDHVNNSEWIISKWAAELVAEVADVKQEFPRLVSFDGSFSQVLNSCLDYLKLPKGGQHDS